MSGIAKMLQKHTHRLIEKKKNWENVFGWQINDLTEFKAIRKLHEVNNHKGEHQLINAYSKAGWIGPKVS